MQTIGNPALSGGLELEGYTPVEGKLKED